MLERVAFLGCGSWGAALSSILSEKGIKTNFWHRNSRSIIEMQKSRKHYLLPSIEFPCSVEFFADLNKAIEGVDSIVVAVPSQNVREVLSKAKETMYNQYRKRYRK